MARPFFAGTAAGEISGAGVSTTATEGPAAEETDAYVVVANWPDTRREHWRTLLRARAIENLAYVIGVNRVGEGGGLRYSGDSAAIAPSGETIAEAGPGESVVYAEIDRERVAEARRTFPYLADRRPEAYRR